MTFAALTGGIASGKSTVAARLMEHGAVVIDADRVAREVVEPGTPALAAIVERFGAGMLLPDGSLDRAALGGIVFSDGRARADLNAIVHPEVWESVVARRAAALGADPGAVVIYDVPLLVEAAEGRPMDFDLVVVVTAPVEERIRRLVQLRGLTEAEARGRVEAQASDDERLAVADRVIDAGGSRGATLAQADRLWQELTTRAARDRVGGAP